MRPEVYVTELTGIFPKHYVVMVNSKHYDTMRLYAGPPLTLNEQYDIAAGYAEALANYTHPCYDRSTRSTETLN